ncbi:MAG: DNA alkylation repair protein, partial [Pseudomonadota bacterium]
MDAFKNQISPELIALIADHLERHLPGFDRDSFTQGLTQKLAPLALKERVTLVADAMHLVLPQDFTARARILAAMLHPDELHHANQPSDADGLCGWGVWPLSDMIARYGLAQFEASLALLKEVTKRGTAEFDVRPFLVQDQDRALAIIAGWVHDPNHHVRRLVSEGTRPRLPWGIRLQGLIQDPTPTLALLKTLRDDPSDYVRRSVANHLNDIAKDHRDLVARLATDWLDGAPAERQRLIRHACRTLIKQGHQQVLAAFGYYAPLIAWPTITIQSTIVHYGAGLDFAVALCSSSDQPQQLMLDYLVHFKKANGTHRAKIFKWTKVELPPKRICNLTRHHPIKPITTRSYYAG